MRTYEIAILIKPSVVNIHSYVMKGMSNGHDKSALFFGYGVNEAEPLIVEISEQNKDTWQLRPLIHQPPPTAPPIREQREIGRFCVQDLGSEHAERTLRTRRMRSSPHVAGRH